MFETTNQIIIAYIHYIDINVWVKKKGIFNGIPSSSNMAMQLESPERNLVGGIPTPLKNMSSSIGMMIPN